MRYLRILALVAVLAVIAAPTAAALAFDDSVFPPAGTVGVPYSFQFKVSATGSGCGPGSYHFHIQSGGLPPGLTLSDEGRITGTPTAAGTWSFWVQMESYSSGCPASIPTERLFSIAISPRLTVTTPSLPPATVNVPYSVKLAADGGGNLTWSVAGGTLPTGITLAADGTLAGTPTAVTTTPVTFTARVTDGTRSDTKNLTLDVVSPLQATLPPLKEAEVGVALKPVALTATGGRGPYKWALTGAPAWLLVAADTGALSGTPTAPGSFPLKATVTDVYGTTQTLDVLLVVKAKLSVVTAKLRPTKVGKLYQVTLRTNGGVGPIAWKVASGKFPVGVRLDRKTGVLSGIPRAAGTSPLVFTATDAYGVTADSTTVVLKVDAVKKPKKKAAA